jgi:hypothetical protein
VRACYAELDDALDAAADRNLAWLDDEDDD